MQNELGSGNLGAHLEFFFCVRGWKLPQQDGPRTEPEPENGTVGTIFPGAGTGTAGTVFQEPKPEPGPCLFVNSLLRYRKTPSREELSEPKTGTARIVPCTNCNRTEPDCGHPAFAIVLTL